MMTHRSTWQILLQKGMLFCHTYITTLKVVHIRSIHIPIKQTRIISSKDKGSILGICNLFPFEQVDDVVDDKGLRR